jgi:hypothetical protein
MTTTTRAGTCQHCGISPGSPGQRGLCGPCFADAAVRTLYTATGERLGAPRPAALLTEPAAEAEDMTATAAAPEPPPVHEGNGHAERAPHRRKRRPDPRRNHHARVKATPNQGDVMVAGRRRKLMLEAVRRVGGVSVARELLAEIEREARSVLGLSARTA